jgi:hypothetical protein
MALEISKSLPILSHRYILKMGKKPLFGAALSAMPRYSSIGKNYGGI